MSSRYESWYRTRSTARKPAPSGGEARSAEASPCPGEPSRVHPIRVSGAPRRPSHPARHLLLFDPGHGSRQELIPGRLAVVGRTRGEVQPSLCLDRLPGATEPQVVVLPVEDGAQPGQEDDHPTEDRRKDGRARLDGRDDRDRPRHDQHADLGDLVQASRPDRGRAVPGVGVVRERACVGGVALAAAHPWLPRAVSSTSSDGAASARDTLSTAERRRGRWGPRDQDLAGRGLTPTRLVALRLGRVDGQRG